MKRYAKLYLKFLLQYVKTLMEYRTDFILGLVGFILVQFTGVIFIRLIFNSIPSLEGWSFHEVLLIYGMAQIPRGLDHIFTDNLWILSGSIILEGRFDKYLVRPLNPLFQLISEKFQPDGFGELIIGILLFSYASVNLNLSFTWGKFLLLLLVVVAASILYTAIKLAVASIAFWIKFAQSYLYMTYQLSTFTKYPLGIYPQAVRFLLTFVVPFAFTGYFPGAYFLGRESLFRGILLTCIVSLVSILLAYRIWLLGISRYESSGS